MALKAASCALAAVKARRQLSSCGRLPLPADRQNAFFADLDLLRCSILTVCMVRSEIRVSLKLLAGMQTPHSQQREDGEMQSWHAYQRACHYYMAEHPIRAATKMHISSDLMQKLWTRGYKLFKSRHSTVISSCNHQIRQGNKPAAKADLDVLFGEPRQVHFDRQSCLCLAQISGCKACMCMWVVSPFVAHVLEFVLHTAK